MISPVYEYRYRWPLQLTGGLFILIGLILGLPGLWLIWLGGSLYYSAAGAALALSGVLLCSGRPTGAWLFAAAVIGTLFWSLWEAGLDGWALLPRLGLFVPLGTLLLVASRLLTGRRIAAGMGLLAAAGVAISLLGDRRPGFLPGDGQTSAQVQIAQAPTMEDTEWPVVGGDPGSTRFSRLHQISPANVSQLQLAWKVHLGFSPSGKPGVLEATPLMVRDLVYTCNMHSEVLALDPETGKTVWRFDPHIDPDAYLLGVCRGVAYYHEAGATGLCGERIISVTLDARMFAVDARTGQRCPHFGNNGEVDLSEGMGVTEKGYYYLTSAPTIVRGKVIVGGLVVDDQYTGEPSGAIRGFDVLTGKFAWVWDMGRPEDHGPPPSGQSFTLGTPNAWGPITGDDQLGLAFVPLGNATPDYVSAHRSAAMNQFTDAVVALDVETGALRWSYQTVHRDVWDYDVASPPTLVEFPTPQGPRPGLIQPTKRGEFFVLDRVTGEPLVETVERAAPQKPVPGETLSPTQPYPVGMPSFGGERLTEANMWGITAFDQLWCRIRFRQARYDGVFTPVGLTPTIIYPGYLGGSEWPGVSVDPDRHLMVLNVSHFAMYDQLISRAEADKLNIRPFKAGQAMDKANNAQAGTPYAVRVSGFVTPLDTPCIKPPYSELAVVDLTTRKVLWRKPLGTARDSGPWNLKFVLPIPMGVPAVGGTLVTRSGLIFIAATQERTFRAFDLKTSELLWQTRLPAGGHAAPMTYYSKRSQRQFLLIPASGHWWMKSGKGDYLLAYTLPEATASRR